MSFLSGAHPRQQARLLPNGRLHLSDGPIDLIIEAVDAAGAVRAAYAAATTRFATVLDELCAELSALRAPMTAELACASPLPWGEVERSEGEGRDLSGYGTPLTPTLSPWERGTRPRPAEVAVSFAGPVSRTMARAVAPYAAAGVFITPMAAVAGAVAEEILGAMLAAAPLARASVNNGGDIALHLAPGERTTIGLVDRADFSGGPPKLFGRATLAASDPVRGIATSGAGGRSFSLGIADAVTVLARTAAEADAAATVIANAVDLPGHPGILRALARQLQPDSDLGDRLVTRAVPRLSTRDIEAALAAGATCAEDLAARGLVCAVALHLQGATRVVGGLLEDAHRAPPSPTLPRSEGARAHA